MTKTEHMIDWSKNTYEIAAEYTAKAERLTRAEDLLAEVVEAMINLAPAVRREREGCFGDRQEDCVCTTCKVRRFLKTGY